MNSGKANQIEFLVKGSEPEPYRVSFKREGRNLSAHCTCSAGKAGKYCDHRINILRGTTDGIVSENASDVATVASWLTGTDVAAALQTVTRLEQEAARVSHDLNQAKQTLSEFLLD